MQLHAIELLIFLVFIVAVVGVGIATSRHEHDSESYFLAGRGLSWWLIGFSLIAANISTEQFVGMLDPSSVRQPVAEFTPRRPQRFQELYAPKDVNYARVPKELPVTLLIGNVHRVTNWRRFVQE